MKRHFLVRYLLSPQTSFFSMCWDCIPRRFGRCFRQWYPELAAKDHDGLSTIYSLALRKRG